jgi:hydrogenase maturation protease
MELAPLLVIGYGNSLRADDGVGPEVARRLAAEAREGVTVISAHQLLPEHAEALSAARRVILVDATAVGTPGEIQVRGLLPDAGADAGRLHEVGPETLLALAQLLYGRAPTATLLTVCGYSFEHRETLTCRMQARLPALERALRALL